MNVTENSFTDAAHAVLRLIDEADLPLPLDLRPSDDTNVRVQVSDEDLSTWVAALTAADPETAKYSETTRKVHVAVTGMVSYWSVELNSVRQVPTGAVL